MLEQINTFFGHTDFWAQAVLLFIQLLLCGVSVCVFAIIIVPYAQSFSRSLKADARRPHISFTERLSRMKEGIRATRIGISLLCKYVFE